MTDLFYVRLAIRIGVWVMAIAIYMSFLGLAQKVDMMGKTISDLQKAGSELIERIEKLERQQQ